MKDLHVRVEITWRSHVPLGADLLPRRNLVFRFYGLRLGVQHFDSVSRTLVGEGIPLFDDNASKPWMDLLYRTVNGRRHWAIRKHTPATIDINTNVRTRALASRGTESTR